MVVSPMMCYEEQGRDIKECSCSMVDGNKGGQDWAKGNSSERDS